MHAVPSIFVRAAILSLLAAIPLFATETNGQQIDYEQPTPLTGRIYDGPNTNKLLFTFRRTATRTNSIVNVSREFRLPNGNLAALEKVTYESGRLVEFELNEPPSGVHSRVIVRPNPPAGTQVTFEYSEGAGMPKRSTETLQPDTLVADMIAPFIHSHWEQLMRGDVVKFRFIAVARRGTIGFKLIKDSESTIAGKRVVRIRMQPTSLFIAAFVDPLYFTVEKDGRHYVLDYMGRTTPRLEKDGEWKDVVALTVFDWPPTK